MKKAIPTLVTTHKPVIVSTEEMAQFVKENKERLILPVDGILPNKTIDSLVYEIKNNWTNGGAECHDILEQMYNVLSDESKSNSSND